MWLVFVFISLVCYFYMQLLEEFEGFVKQILFVYSRNKKTKLVQDIMNVGRVGMFNFLTKADCKNSLWYIQLKYQTYLKEVFLEMTWFRASDESILMFVIFETKEIGDQLFSEMSEWRKQNDFRITDTIVFDGDVIDQLGKK